MPSYIIHVGSENKPFTGSLKQARAKAKYWAAAYEKDASIYNADTMARMGYIKAKRNSMATKKKKKKAKAKPAKKNRKRSTAKNRKQTRAKTKKRSTARSKSNPGAKLRSKISQMKPGSWYPTTLSGARVKVQRKGNSLVIRPATKKRSR
jgi:hypothetical protein